MERITKEGNSPVPEIVFRARGILSSAIHVEFGVNLGGPPSKAKYKLVTDSEQVPRGKGEKNPVRGVK